MDYNKFLTEVNKRRTRAQLREAGKRMFSSKVPYYSLAGGLPMPEIFSFKNATFQLTNGEELVLDDELMNMAQQYGITEGFPPLRQMLKEFQTKRHNPPESSNWDMIIASAQQCLSTIIEMILSEGDYVIGQKHVYASTMNALQAINVRYLTVESDDFGVCPDSLKKVLSRWDPEFSRENKDESPKMLILVPNGGNPETSTLPTERRKEIYKLAQEYNLLIMEDDPYHFIVFDQEIPPSFLALDVDGRVLRCDSFSKILAPGFRLGMLTAAKPFIEAAVKHIQVMTQQPCCLTQVLLYKLLLKWGYDGFVKNGQRCCNEFKKQKDLCMKYINKWLSGLVTVMKPSGGMFLWIKVDGVKCTRELCAKAETKNAYFAPGSWFTFNNEESPYIRLSFSFAKENDFDAAFRILAEVIQEEKRKQNNSNCVQNGIK